MHLIGRAGARFKLTFKNYEMRSRTRVFIRAEIDPGCFIRSIQEPQRHDLYRTVLFRTVRDASFKTFWDAFFIRAEMDPGCFIRSIQEPQRQDLARTVLFRTVQDGSFWNILRRVFRRISDAFFGLCWDGSWVFHWNVPGSVATGQFWRVSDPLKIR